MTEQIENNEIENIDEDRTRECVICYERKRWGCDGGDFLEGYNCDHMVCVDCSVRITRCPFCRKPWREEDEEEDEEDEEDEDDDEYDEVWRDHIREYPGHRYCRECGCCENCGVCECEEVEEDFVILTASQEEMADRINAVVYQARQGDNFLSDADGKWQFETAEDAIRVGAERPFCEDEDIIITKTSLLSEDECEDLGVAYVYEVIFTIYKRKEEEDEDTFTCECCGVKKDWNENKTDPESNYCLVCIRCDNDNKDN